MKCHCRILFEYLNQESYGILDDDNEEEPKVFPFCLHWVQHRLGRMEHKNRQLKAVLIHLVDHPDLLQVVQGDPDVLLQLLNKNVRLNSTKVFSTEFYET